MKNRTPQSEALPRIEVLTVARTYRAFGRYYRPYVPALVLSQIGLLVTVAMALLTPWPLKLILDHVVLRTPFPARAAFLSRWSAEPLTLLAVLAGAFVALRLIDSLAQFVHKVGLLSAGERILADIRERLFAHLQRLSLSFHESRGSGDLVVRVLSDMSHLKTILLDVPEIVMQRALMIVSHVGLMLFLNWRLALIAFAVIPVLYLLNRRIGVRVRQASRTKRVKEGHLATLAWEQVTSMALVQAYGREDLRQERFAIQNRESLKSGLKAMRLSKTFKRTSDIVIAVGTCSVVYLGGRLALDHAILPGTLVLFVAYLRNLYDPINKFTEMMLDIAGAQASAERLLDIVEHEPLVRDAPHAVVLPPVTGRIEFDAVGFGYRAGVEVLRDVSFAVEPGETVALVGRNGAGKSTLIRLLLRFYDPQRGAVKIDGRDLKGVTLESLRRSVTIVMQDAKLLQKTVRETIAFGKPDATEEEIVRAARLAQAHEFILRMPQGYDTLIEEGGDNLSGGERQRLNIARGIIRDTRIVVLDEPSTALDARADAKLHQALAALTRGKTVILIAHARATFAGADRIVVLEGGRVAAVGTHPQLLRESAEYRALCSEETPDRAAPGTAGGKSGRADPRTGPRSRSLVLPHAHEFPQLETIADLEGLAGVLSRALESVPAEGRLRVAWCAIEEFHYRRGKECRLLLRAGLEHDAGARTREQLFFGRLHPPGRPVTSREATTVGSLVLPDHGPAAFSLPTLRFELWAYPNDPDLPGLSALLDHERLLVRIQADPAAFGLSEAPADLDPVLVKYVPGKRAGVRVDFTSAATGASQGAVYGRAYHGRQGERAHRVLSALWDSVPRRAGRFQVPRPLGFDPTTQVVWQEALEGRPLGKQPDLERRLPEMAATLGGSLAALHEARLELPSKATLGTLGEELVAARGLVGETYPEHAERCRALAGALLASRPDSSGPRACVHGSLKLGHLFSTERGLAFIDLDGAGAGDAAYDLGCWIAHLHRLSAAGRLPGAVVARARDRFVESYARRAPTAVGPEVVAWTTAAHLLAGAVGKSVKRMDPRLLEVLVARAEEVAGG
ncbi:MAG TPA: ABC transporter transmembrane domain-containing protein [Candidatus Eisenbacteria bacterium]|jgi:ATP-binding cassette subfamily B protein